VSAGTAEAIVEVRDVVRHYDSAAGTVHALRGVSLEVRAGEVVAVIGPSGSGKSTLLGLIAGLDRPSGGTVTLLGQRVDRLAGDAAADFRRRHVGFVFQFFNLIPTMTAADNVAIPLLAEGLSRREIDARVHEALRAVALDGLAPRRAIELSGGERQRVAIARALVMQPRVLLADEPTGNLDSVTGERILGLLWAQREVAGRALVLATHSYQGAAGADRIVVLRDGRVVEELGPGDLDPGLRVVGRSGVPTGHR
jgi:putative ABC transport system ATP-binding protein